MDCKPDFPPDLLDLPTGQRLDFFKKPNGAIMHHKLKKVFERLYRLILKPAGASFTLVMGPSGVGKTTLLDLVCRKILEVSLPQMEKDPGWYPIIHIEAPANTKGFRWKPFYKEILLAVDEPCIDQKIRYDEDGIRRDRDGKLVIATRATEDSLRLAAKNACLHRKPYTLAIDEFEHIGIAANEEVIEAHMDCAKYFVNQTKVPWTAFGTYKLLDFIELNDQLSRRDRIIHFQRYRLENDNDIEEFKQLLEYLIRRMPLKRTPKITNKLWEFCYEGSIGNFGTLFDWLVEAYDLCLSENGSTLAFEHLEETISSEAEREKMLAEAEKGESRLTRSKEKRKSFRARLGFDKVTTQSPVQQSTSNTNQQQESPEQNNQTEKAESGKTERKGRNKPFKRNPKRDPVRKGSEQGSSSTSER